MEDTLFTDLFREVKYQKKLYYALFGEGIAGIMPPQESFFGHMKDEIDVKECKSFRDVKSKIEDWLDYYNNERYQWQLSKLSPNQYYEYLKTGLHPLEKLGRGRDIKNLCS